ncbi:MAG: DUF6297 family protein [Arachnia sp.]
MVACGVAGPLGVLAAVLAQQDGWRSLWSLGAVGVGVVLLGGVGLVVPMSSWGIALLTAGAVAALGCWYWLRARAGLAGMSASSLVRQGRLRSSLAGAVSSADAGFVLDLVSLRLIGSPDGRSLAPRARAGWRALAGYELRRLAARSPRLLLGIAAALIVVLAIPMAPSAVLVLSSVALVPALGLMLTSLRAVSLAPGLKRAVGLAPVAQVASLATGAAGATIGWIAWSSLLLLASGWAPDAAVLLAWSAGVAGLAAAVRRVAAPAPNFTSGILLTDAGPVPVSALMTALTGLGGVISVAMMILAGAPPILCAAVASVALLWSVRAVARTLAGSPVS